jgi:competence protein ComEC
MYKIKTIQFPLIRIALFFITGILFAFYSKPSIILTTILLIISLLFFCIGCLRTKIFGITCFILSFSIGLFTQTFHSTIFNENHYINQIGTIEKTHLLEITIKEKLKNTVQNARFVANINRIENKKSCGKILLNIRKEKIVAKLNIGLILKIKALIHRNQANNNPNQFDYGQYLENQKIYGQVFTDLMDIQISSKIDKDIWYYTANFRNQIISNLQKNGFAKKELAVIVALILGQQQEVSKDILQDYQFAGAIHILSVSGLHVGFILFFIEFILKPFSNNPKNKFIKLIIKLLSLCLFGFVAGFAPAILRSVVMYSFVIIGQYLNRGVNIFNTLLVSAFLILLCKPNFLFDVGFQLSYISLFFILWLQPVLAKLWRPKNKIYKNIWDILTVSFAAQIGAFPLSIYYFHQFPGLFFITNLVVLPCIGLIMGYGVFVMLLAYFDLVSSFLIKILEYFVWILDKTIGFIASFEQFIIQNIPMNLCLLCGLYFMIVGIIIWFKKPDFNKLTFALLSILIFQITCLTTKFSVQNQQAMIVFSQKKGSLVTETKGDNTTVYVNHSIDLDLSKNINLNSYLVGNFSRLSKIKKTPNLLYFKNLKVLVLDNVAFYPTELKPDLLIITQSPKLNLERFLQQCRPKIIVADGSNFKSYVKIWQATCIAQKIKFHDCTNQGFFKI